MTEPTDIHDEDLELHPAWRQAVAKFLDQAFSPGDILSFEWLHGQFNINMLHDETLWKEAEKSRLAFLGQFKPFETHLLDEHRIALASVRGVGYRVVPASEQTGWAEKEGRNELKRALRKMGRRLTSVDHAQLTNQQRRENADAHARWSMLRGMTQRVEKIEAPEDDDAE